MYNPALSCHIQ